MMKSKWWVQAQNVTFRKRTRRCLSIDSTCWPPQKREKNNEKWFFYY